MKVLTSGNLSIEPIKILLGRLKPGDGFIRGNSVCLVLNEPNKILILSSLKVKSISIEHRDEYVIPCQLIVSAI